MQKITPILLSILTIAIIVLYVLHFSLKTSCSNSELTSNSSKNDSLLTPSSGVSVYMNTDSLEANYVYLKDMRDELASEKLKYESQMNGQLTKLEKDVMAFQEKARLMTQTEGEQKQMELAQREQELMKLEQDLNTKLIDSEKDRNKEIQKEIALFLEKYNKEHNYSFVFGYNGWGNLLFASNSLDITNDVLEGLNQEYIDKKDSKIKAEAE